MNTNIELLNKIRSDTSAREKVIISLAKDLELKSSIMNYIVKNSGSMDDATMVFHDAIIAFVKKVFMDKDFTIESNLNAYIFGIAKYQWFQKIRANKNARSVSLDDAPEISDGISVLPLAKGEKHNILRAILGHLRTNCKDVLMYWAGGYNMEEIAKHLGYKSEGMARKKKYQCYKELVSWLDDHPQYKLELND